MTHYPIDRKVWEQGLTSEAFIERMTEHKGAMQRRLAQVRLSPEEQASFQKLDRKPVYMLVMTEEWCSDCLMNLPILIRIAEAAPNMPTRIFIRREWPELRAYYNGQDIPSIPVATFLDDDFNPIGSWIERPVAAHVRLAEWKAAHPEIEITRRRADLTAEQKREMLHEVLDQLLVEMEEWYNAGLQSETVREVADLLGLAATAKG